MKVILTETVWVVANHFARAESNVREVIKGVVGPSSEPEITVALRSEFATLLHRASDDGKIARAFAQDLKRFLEYNDLTLQFVHDTGRLAEGLIAGVSWHAPQTEGQITGGDFGIVISQPDIVFAGEALHIDAMKNRCGLLAQAKLKQAQGGWGSLSPKQKKLLPGREKCLALLLYEYVDKRKTELNPFKWVNCRGSKIGEIGAWLKSGIFPEATNSPDILKRLGEGSIGTKDQSLIDKIVAPPTSPYLTIWIDWPDSKPPHSRIYALSKQDLEIEVQARVGVFRA